MAANIRAKGAWGGDMVAPVRYGVKDGTVPGFGQARPDERLVTYRDMRANADPPQLFREGFELFHHTSSMTNFEDGEAVAKIYLPEIRELMRAVTGTSEVYLQTNWVLRAESKPAFEVKPVARGTHAHTQMKTGGFLHIDYDASAAVTWAKRALADAKVTAWPAGRLLVLTAWRAISAPPQDKPLALVDRRTVHPQNLILEKIATPSVQWNGYQVSHNAAHRFCWWSEMTRDEVILFSQHEDGIEPLSAAPHTAFQDPRFGPDAPPRHSIEVRGYCFLKS